MDNNDWDRFYELYLRTCGAVASGELTENQLAMATSFQVLSQAILDVNERLAKIESSTDKPLVIGTPYGY